MKPTIRAMITGSLITGAVTSFLAPKVIAWWFEPPVALGFSCRISIEYALRRLQWAQGIGLGVGALLGLGVYFFWRKRSHQS